MAEPKSMSDRVEDWTGLYWTVLYSTLLYCILLKEKVRPGKRQRTRI